jgi:selenophosphate synthetase-related protein
MALADALKKETDIAPRNSICSIAKAVQTMKPEDITTLNKVLYDRNIKASVLGRALRKEGIDISETTITRHRNGWCKTCASE